MQQIVCIVCILNIRLIPRTNRIFKLDSICCIRSIFHTSTHFAESPPIFDIKTPPSPFGRRAVRGLGKSWEAGGPAENPFPSHATREKPIPTHATTSRVLKWFGTQTKVRPLLWNMGLCLQGNGPSGLQRSIPQAVARAPPACNGPPPGLLQGPSGLQRSTPWTVAMAPLGCNGPPPGLLQWPLWAATVHPPGCCSN